MMLTIVPNDKTTRNFMNKVVVSESGCWMWQGGGNGRYGQIGYTASKGVYVSLKATHYALALRGLQRSADAPHALHSDDCDSSMCVNPDHLRWGTHELNMDDRTRLGRTAKGRKIASAKLTEADVIEILQSKDNHTQLARRFGVSTYPIEAIRKGKTWKHLTQNQH